MRSFLFFVLTWLAAMAAGRRVAVYFTALTYPVLLTRATLGGVAEGLLRLLASWLQPRTARVAVNGSISDVVDMNNMVYQGTGWG